MTVPLMSNFVRHAINFRENSNGRCKGACGILLESYSSTTKNISATIMSICQGGDLSWEAPTHKVI